MRRWRFLAAFVVAVTFASISPVMGGSTHHEAFAAAAKTNPCDMGNSGYTKLDYHKSQPISSSSGPMWMDLYVYRHWAQQPNTGWWAVYCSTVWGKDANLQIPGVHINVWSGGKRVSVANHLGGSTRLVWTDPVYYQKGWGAQADNSGAWVYVFTNGGTQYHIYNVKPKNVLYVNF
jgi:hypothetical protein